MQRNRQRRKIDANWAIDALTPLHVFSFKWFFISCDIF